MPFGGSLLDQSAHCGAACEADVINARMFGQSIAHLMAIASHDVDSACRKTHFSGQLRHANQAQAGIFCRFDNTDIACCQSTAYTATKNLHGVVPRHDVTCDAMGLAPSEHAVAILVGNGFAMELVASTSVVFKVTNQVARVVHGLLGWLAAVALLKLHQLVGVLSHFA